jgi:hypothetical protein
MITKLTPYIIAHAKSFERDFTKEEWVDFGNYKTKILRLYKIYEWVLDSIKGKDLETFLLVNFLKNRGYTDFIPPEDIVSLPWEYFDQSGQFYDDYVIEQSLGVKE